MINAKQIIRAVILAVCAVAVASCSEDGLEVDTPGGPNNGSGGDITFDIGFAPATRVSTGADFTSKWEDGDEIGIFACENGTTLAASDNHIHNVRLTYSGGSWSLDDGVELWFPTGGVKLDFFAYYPYDDNGGTPEDLDPTAIAFNVLTDQSGTTGTGADERLNYNLSDLLAAASDNSGSGWGKNDGPVSLQFSHALAMVEVTLDNEKDAIDHNEDLTVTLRSVKLGAVLNLGGGTGPQVTVPTADNEAMAIKMYRVQQPDDSDYRQNFTFRVLVPAQDIPQDANMFLIRNGNLLLTSSAVTADIELKAAQAEQFTQILPYHIHTVDIPAAGQTFEMGQADITNATPVHNVTLTENFRMSKYAVTNAQYAVFLNDEKIGENGQGTVLYENNGLTDRYTGRFIYSNVEGVQWDGSNNKWVAATGYENHPIINVTWYGAKAYCDWLTQTTDEDCRLPTEAQWEFACRAGTTTAFHFGDDENDLENYGWHSGNSSDATKAVGQKLPNQYGLYDMHGNVWEWCSDWYGSYGSGFDTDPTGPISGSDRVLRGGGWSGNAQSCRSAYRRNVAPSIAVNYFGFRVIFVP